jgi:hypothetical protein
MFDRRALLEASCAALAVARGGDGAAASPGGAAARAQTHLDLGELASSFRILDLDADPDRGNITGAQIVRLEASGQTEDLAPRRRASAPRITSALAPRSTSPRPTRSTPRTRATASAATRPPTAACSPAPAMSRTSESTTR